MADLKENVVEEANGVELKKMTNTSSELALAPKAKCDSLHSLDNSVDEGKGDAKYTKKGDDSAVEIGGSSGAAFAGMGKDELMKYANDPFWVRLRWFLFILFWLAWLAMLAGAITIVVLAPKCPAPAPLDYWQKGAVYSVNVKSFQDSDDDGKGDLKGLMGRLDHFVHLGVNMIALSPIFPGEDVNYGHEVTDFLAVHPDYGTVEDYKALCQAAKAKDLKVILDFVPNHSSKKHNWFVKSAQNDDTYADYYIWRPAAGSTTWKTVFGGDAWTRDGTRGLFYYHKYSADQPDLNLRNPAVRRELNETFRYWLNQGTAGFRLLSTPYLFESEDANQPDTVTESKTKHLQETFDYLRDVRAILQEYEDKDGEHRVLLVETENSDTEDAIRYYGTEDDKLADVAVNSQLKLQKDFTGAELQGAVKEYASALMDWGWPNWVLGNADTRRAASRYGTGMVDALAMVQFLLPGTPFIYYGEDIGMEDVAVNNQAPGSCSMTPLTPNFKCNQARTPYQWDSTRYGGFSNATPWIDVGNNLASVNAEAQMAESGSHMAVYQALSALRKKEPAMQFGDLSFPEVFNKTNIFSFMRIRKGAPGYLVIVNTNEADDEVDLSGVGSLASEAQIVIRTGSTAASNAVKVETKAIPVKGKEGLVLSFVPKS